MIKQVLLFLICFTMSLVGEEKEVLDTRLEKLAGVRIGNGCKIAWKGDTYRGEVVEIEDEGVLVKVFDLSFKMGEWPLISYPKDQVMPLRFDSAETQEELIDSFKERHLLCTPKIEQAFRKVDRALFCAPCPYYDASIEIGNGMCISSPDIHIWYLELMKEHLEGARSILDVGTGSGYLAVILSHLVSQASIYAIDYYPTLVEKARHTLKQHFPEVASRITMLVGDGNKGYPPGAPYDIITVGYMCEEIYQPLVDQLKVGGIMVFPLSTGQGTSSYSDAFTIGKFMVLRKNKRGQVETCPVFSCSFVPDQSVN